MKKCKKLLALILSTVVMLSDIPIALVAAESTVSTEISHGTGANAVTDETKAKLREHNAQPTVSLSAILPSSIDNSATKYFPPIANQGSDNSCVGFATTYYQMTYSVAKAMNASYSEYTFAPNWTYSLTNEGVDNGADIYKAYNVLSKLGAAKKTEFTGSKTSIETNTDVWKSAMKYRLGVNNNAWHIHEFANEPISRGEIAKVLSRLQIARKWTREGTSTLINELGQDWRNVTGEYKTLVDKINVGSARSKEIVTERINAMLNTDNREIAKTIADWNTIPEEYQGYVANAYKEGFINGYDDNTFKSDKLVTRAEAVTMLENFRAYILVDAAHR